MEWTTEKIVILIFGGGGTITGLVLLFNAIAARIDIRNERKKKADLDRIANAVEVKRLQADTDERSAETLVSNLWKLVETKNKEIAELKQEIEQLEKEGKLTRPVINQIYAKLRAMRKEIESLNLMILNEEETNVFMRRFGAVKMLLDEAEGLLP